MKLTMEDKEKLNRIMEINDRLNDRGTLKEQFDILSQEKIELCNGFMERFAEENGRLSNLFRAESYHTKEAMEDRNYTIPGPFVTAVVVPGKTTDQRIAEAKLEEIQEIKEMNKLLGGKVLLSRLDYENRSHSPLKPRKSSERGEGIDKKR